ncbi:SDR family NAD(P)-dependent oxidoreductase [Streptomyces sp. CNS654]|uniref:SDR family NAD(P)-dependent oxidoreductase n=1 Tax=Streptomyces sp. CNS654 TaxID=1506995 RepID=UPI00067DA198|nr:SDR family oxidoreductase [Streptomyces sp. CNS654]
MAVQSALRIYKDATAIITGGASGIGRALAEELAARGCEVVLADLQLEQAEEVAAAIRSAGGRATAARLDVTDHEEFERLVEETVARTGRLDFLFNNAGISHGMGAGARHYRIEDWRRVIEVNVGGTVNGVQAAYNLMIEQGFGHIVNTASMAGLVPSPGTTSYVTTKHAVVGLSHNLRAEAAQLGVRVSVLCPGVIRTPFIEGGTYGRRVEGVTSEATREMWEQKKPISPEKFARKALDEVARNKGVVIVPGFWKLFWLLFRLAPKFCLNIATKNFKDLGRSPAAVGRTARKGSAAPAEER